MVTDGSGEIARRDNSDQLSLVNEVVYFKVPFT